MSVERVQHLLAGGFVVAAAAISFGGYLKSHERIAMAQASTLCATYVDVYWDQERKLCLQKPTAERMSP